MDDYYVILGIGKNASHDEIKKAYRNLALKYHPDRNKEKSAEEHFKKINEAYAVLGDPEKRQRYDAYGPEGFGQRYSEEDIFRGFDFEDIFRDLGINFNFGNFSGGYSNPNDIFDTLFQQQQQSQGISLNLSFDDIEKGMEREFKVQHYQVCSNCKGSGGEPGSKQVKCQACNGNGTRHVRQSTPFGRFEMTTVCEKCGGRGKLYENICRVCDGNGRVVVTDKFRVKVEKVGSDSEKKRAGFFVGF